METIALTYGELPSKETIVERNPDSYELGFSFHGSGDDYDAFQRAINQGIDSHLEAIMFKPAFSATHALFAIQDGESLYVLLRRLCAQEDDESLDLASCILSTLNIEWV